MCIWAGDGRRACLPGVRVAAADASGGSIWVERMGWSC